MRCRKQRRKRYGSYSRRGRIPNCVPITERPAVVAKRVRFGDWKADTIIGRNHKAAIVSLVERKSKLTRLAIVARRTAELVAQAVSAKLQPLTVKTITRDTGREFAAHQQISQNLQAAFYFVHPYHARERATNENTNGLVRQYFPKKADIHRVACRSDFFRL